MELDKLIPKFILNKFKISHGNTEKVKLWDGLVLSDIKTHHKVTIIKSTQYWLLNRQTKGIELEKKKSKNRYSTYEISVR